MIAVQITLIAVVALLADADECSCSCNEQDVCEEQDKLKMEQDAQTDEIQKWNKHYHFMRNLARNWRYQVTHVVKQQLKVGMNETLEGLKNVSQNEVCIQKEDLIARFESVENSTRALHERADELYLTMEMLSEEIRAIGTALNQIQLSYTVVRSQAACFLDKISGCGQKVALKTSVQNHDFTETCKHKEDMLSCLQDFAVECKVEKKYDFHHFERVLNELCRDGSELNIKVKEHDECISEIDIKRIHCLQDIVDFKLKIKDWTPEAILELSKLRCKEKTKIQKCYSDNVEEHCGKQAREVFDIFIGSADHVSELICKDVLHE